MSSVVERLRRFIVLEGVKEGDAPLNCRLHRAGAGRREDHGPEMVDVWRWREGQDPDDQHAKEHPAVLRLIDRTMIPEEMVDTSRVVVGVERSIVCYHAASPRSKRVLAAVPRI
jgi:hypothetical protein